MTAIFPKAAYAEDQIYAKTILTFHVLRAGFTAGAVVSVPIAVGLNLVRGPRNISELSRQMLVSCSRGSAAGFIISGGALAWKMWNTEDIEWQDRSWRLLENKGQVEVDNWILGGGAVGAAVTILAVRRGKMPGGLENRVGAAVLGGTGIGSVLGTVGYMNWRYGIHGGWKEGA